MADAEENTAAAATSAEMSSDAPAAAASSSSSGDAGADAGSKSASAVGGADSSSNAPVKEKKEKKKKHKDKKEKKRKKDKKHKKDKHKSESSSSAAAAGDSDKKAESEGAANANNAAADAEMEEEMEDEEEEESEESESSSSSDEEDEEAELRDPEEEERRRQKKLRKKQRAKAGVEKKKKRKRREPGSKFLDVEVEVSSDEEVSADEDEGEDNDGFLKDLVVPDAEVEAEMGPRSRKRKRGKIIDAELDEDDYNLLKENLGMEVHTTNIDQDVDKSDDEDAGDRKRSRLKKGPIEKKIDFEELERQKREKEMAARLRKQKGEIDDYAMDEDDDAGFLAPEDDETARASKKKHRDDSNMADFVEEDDTTAARGKARGEGGVSAKERERLEEFFGSVTAFFQTKRGAKVEDEEDSDGAYGDEEPAEEQLSEADSEDERIKQKRRQREAVSEAKVKAQKERENQLLETRHLDIPERLQARAKKRRQILAVEGGDIDGERDTTEREEEAQWIFEQMYRQSSSSQSVVRSESALVPTIRSVLRYLQEDHLEVQFIATYRKEHWCGTEMPQDAVITEDELFKIDELDEKWMELGTRKKKLTELLSEYQETAYVQNLHESESSSHPRSYQDYATPSSFTLNEWKRLLSSRELSGLLELDDVQDALTVLGMVEQSKKKRAAQEKRELKEFERRERRERRAALIKERQEAFARRREEREKRRAEIASAGDGAAPADVEEEEELNLDDIDIKSEDDADEDVEMADADEKQPRGARARLNRAKFHFLNQAWTVPGVPQLAASLGLNPAEFAENLQYNFLKVHPRDGVWNVDYLSEEAIKLQKAKNPDEVLSGARRYVAYLIATEPLVRRFVRKEFLQLVEIWTFPTAKGVRELDDTHEYSSVRRIESKPLNRMKEHPAQFLLMHQAEKDGFIRVEFRLPKNTEPTNRVASLSMEEPESNGITATLCQLFLSSSTSPDARLWNDERRKVIHDAMAVFLLPLCEAHARSLLLKDAIEFVNDQIATRLTNALRNQGFAPPPSAVPEEEEEESSRKKKKKKDRADPDNWRIFSLIVGDEKSPTYIAVLNRYGGVIDHACLHFLKSNVQPRNRPGETATEAERNQLARKKEDTRKFLELVQTHSPKLIVVDAANMDCRSFKEELATRTLAEYAGQIRVEFMDPELSRIYMNSARAELEFKEYPRNLRQAISMGRQALDPVAEFSGLYSGPIDAEQWSESANTSAQLMQSIETTTNQDEILKKDIVVAATNALQNDMLALSLHPLQRNIPTKLLLNTMQRVLVRMVNYSGVDINKIVQRPWLTGSIQFLTGLGPIKAKYFLDYVKKNNCLTSRDELKNESLGGIDAKKSVSDFTAASAAAKGKNVPIFGPCLFRNVAGFIIIHRNTYMTDAKLHPLDETRIHPERYALAQQVALDALDVTAEVLEAQQVEKVEKALKKASRKEEEEEDLDYYDEYSGEIDEHKKAAKDEARQKRVQEKVYLDMMKEYIKAAMEQSELIDQLSFEAFCKNEKDLELQGGEPYEPKMESLLQIASELKHPFSDVKQLFNAFASPSAHRLFYLLTGETSRTLREGLLLPVVINGIHPQAKGAYVRLDSNVRGFLAFRNVSDNAPRPPRREDVTDPQLEVENQMAWLKSRLTPGMSVNARILKLEKDKFMVELSTRSSDLNQATWIAGAGLRAAQQQEIERKFGRRTVEEVDDIEQALYFDDPYLFVGTHPEDAALLAAEAGPVKAEKRFRQRNITHTLFRNIGREEAIGELRDKPMGEVVVRPSTLGSNHLTLTWKVSDQEITNEAGQTEKGIYFNVDIKEEQKPNELEIGTRLIVKEGKYVYEDLDEIVARFITPMIRWVNELTAHKNFRFGNEAEIHGILFAEKQQDRSKFPYALHFATSAKRVGAFQFSFLPNADVKSSSFVVVPEGYLYHERTYSNVNSLLAAIKTEMSSKVGVAPPAGSQKVAAAGSRSSRSGSEKKSSSSLPPYAGAANAAPAAASSSSSRPPYAAAASSSSSSATRPPYAAAAASAPPSRPYDSRPPYGAPPQPYGAAPYGGAPPQQYPPQPYGYAPPPPQGYYQQPPPQSTAPSGYVHPARAGIVPSGYPQQPPQQYGGYPPQQQQQPRDGPRRSRWTGNAPGSNARDDEMEM